MSKFEIFGPSGILKINLANRLPRFIGQVLIGPAAGSVIVPTPQGTQAWWALFPYQSNTADFNYPIVSVTPAGPYSTISWTARAAGGSGQMIMSYGIW